MNSKLERIYKSILYFEIIELFGSTDKSLDRHKRILKTIKSIIEDENGEYVEKHVLNPASSNEKCDCCGRYK